MKISLVIGKHDCYFKVINDKFPNVLLVGDSYWFNTNKVIRFSPKIHFEKCLEMYDNLRNEYDIVSVDPNIISDIFYYFQLDGFKYEENQYKRCGTYPNSCI